MYENVGKFHICKKINIYLPLSKNHNHLKLSVNETIKGQFIQQWKSVVENFNRLSTTHTKNGIESIY